MAERNCGCRRLRRLTQAPAALQHANRGWLGLALRRDAELARWQLDPARLELRHERRSEAGRPKLAFDPAVLEGGLLEDEDVLGEDLVVFDPIDLGDVDDLPGSVLQPGGVDDQVHGRGDLFPDRAKREFVTGHQDHRLETSKHVLRTVRVAGRERSVMTRRHRLEHVERFARTALPDDDPVGPHVESVPQQVADRDLALTLEVWWSRLEGDDVLLAELEL